MAKVPLRDLVVVLPGITGSVLQRNGRDVWAFSGQALWEIITSLGDSLQQLRLGHEDPIEADDLGDGIRATALIPDIHLIPGLVKIDGYSQLLKAIIECFDVTPGKVQDQNERANFFAFPYDWRRDNRVAARQLKQFIDQQLPLWRHASYNEQARVILIAHSMGGLIARYYLEVLEGWQDCRVLITFGTPYRGSLNALGFLANGYKKQFLDLTDVMRSFTSVYQLLPIYQAVKDGGSFARVAEIDGIPNVVRTRAQEALAFHRDIEKAVNAHRNDPTYLDPAQGYKVLPIVGTRQPTAQSAVLEHGCLTISRELPEGVDPLLADGDGTVPRVSAIPIELSKEYYNTFVPERHSSLQCHTGMLDELCERLKQMQVRGQEAVRGPEIYPDVAGWPALALYLDDIYVNGEPVELRAHVVNAPLEVELELEAEIQAADGNNLSPAIRRFHQEGDDWVLREEGLPPGLYRVTVHTVHRGPWAPPPVHDLFEVAPRDH
jgi:pimeloyl-ACP methyl ester carboxylesterase